MYKVRFDLGPHIPVPAGTAEEHETEGTCDDARKDARTCTTDQLLRRRINNLQGFMKQRKTRLREARRRTKISSGLIASANFTIQNCKKSLQKSQDARYGEITMAKTHKNDADCKGETPKSDSSTRCEECHKLMKERDKFWGLESDSEEDDIKNFNEHVRRRSMRRDSKNFSSQLGNANGYATSSPRRSGVASRRKPKGIAGRGTWATPAYVPPWELSQVDRGRADSILSDTKVLEEARFGQKKGM